MCSRSGRRSPLKGISGLVSLSPVIVCGMHRSGTSMVIRFLEEMGLFTGQRKDENGEALFFLEINDWMLRQAGASWDLPEGFKTLLGEQDLRRAVGALVSLTIHTPRARSYLGLWNYLRWRTPFALTRPWGWKDPRNTITLPIWLDLFPDARIIHVRRHGVDVANSLVRRRDSAMQSVGMPEPKPEFWESLFLDLPEISGLAHCTNLETAFRLWEWYLEVATAHVKVADASVLEVQYENLLENPYEGFVRLAEFCELSANKALTEQAAASVDNGRAFAFRGNPELESLAEKNASSLQRFGY